MGVEFLEEGFEVFVISGCDFSGEVVNVEFFVDFIKFGLVFFDFNKIEMSRQ